MEKKFRNAVVIFIDILGSQNRENFDEWYNIMNIFSTTVEHEKELDNTHPVSYTHLTLPTILLV